MQIFEKRGKTGGIQTCGKLYLELIRRRHQLKKRVYFAVVLSDASFPQGRGGADEDRLDDESNGHRPANPRHRVKMEKIHKYAKRMIRSSSQKTHSVHRLCCSAVFYCVTSVPAAQCSPRGGSAGTYQPEESSPAGTVLSSAPGPAPE